MNKRFLLSIIISLLLVACGQSVDLTESTDVNDKHSSENIEKNTDDTPDKANSTPKEKSESDPKLLNDLKIHYIDAGQADATLFQYTYEDKSYTILYDAGDWNKSDVVNYLAKQDFSVIDLIIISHPHADHTGQLAEIVNTYDVDEVWLSGNTANTKTFQEGLEAVLASDANYYEPRTGETFDIGPLKIEVLHPGSISGDLNEESISLLFTYGTHKFLFTGDAGKSEELEMMNSGFNVEADILQLGHHGSNTSTDPKFIKAVQPDIAIYSAGVDNSYGHPHAEVVSLVQSAGITLYGTDVHGTILVTTDGDTYTIETKEDGTISPKSKQDEPKKEEIVQSEAETNTAKDSCIDINEDSIDEIQKIIHIGPERAKDLIDLRPYDSIDDLTSIKGVGPARIADIKDQGLVCSK